MVEVNHIIYDIILDVDIILEYRSVCIAIVAVTCFLFLFFVFFVNQSPIFEAWKVPKGRFMCHVTLLGGVQSCRRNSDT